MEAEERTADEKYWTNIQAEHNRQDEEKRKADNTYWASVRKAKEDNTPSNLKFGLL